MGAGMSEDSHEDHGTARWLVREEAHSRQLMSTAKVVVTFSAAIAASFVTAAMEAKDPGWWDEVAAALMIATLAVTVWVVVLPRKSRLKVEHVRAKSPKEVQDKLVLAATDDAQRARFVQTLMVTQVLLSLASSFVASYALLRAGWP